MHVVIANSAFDLPIPDRHVLVLHTLLHIVQHGMRLLGVAAQGVVFCAVLWLLVAGPGFLSARDSLIPATADRLAFQASR